MSNYKRSRILILIFAALLVISIMIFSTLPEKPVNGITSPFSVALRPFERLFSSATGSISRFFHALSENRELREENARLKDENLDLRLRIKDNEQAALAYAELKQAFALKDRYPAREFLAANILQRPLEEGERYFRLDVGSADGLTFDETTSYPVLDERARLIGRVDIADAVSSMMLPLDNPGFTFNGLAERDAEHSFPVHGLKTEGGKVQLKAEAIVDECAIQPGDRIFCSGRGGIFPEGVLCGKVLSVSERDSQGFRTALIEAEASPDQLNVVFIILPRSAAAEKASATDAAEDLDGEETLPVSTSSGAAS